MVSTMHVYVKTQFEGIHRWKDAPPEVLFLGQWHRHVFHVRVMVPVKDDNREVEFIQLKWKLQEFIGKTYRKPFEFSCEQIARQIGEEFKACMVDVSEDGENGAVYLPPCEGTYSLPVRHRHFEMLDKQVLDAARVKRDKQVDEDLAKGMEELRKVLKGSRSELSEGTGIPISLVIRTKCFVGQEIEGPKEGLFTLFVPGSVTPKEFSEAWIKVNKKLGETIAQVYFGAGNDCENLNQDTFDAIRDTVPSPKITVECRMVTPWLPRIVGDAPHKDGPLIVSRNDNDVATADYFKKFEGQEAVVWIENTVSLVGEPKRFIANLKDERFNHDTYVEDLV